ncbi:MAG: Gfo/Idh/MocA family protein [Solirubrobacteraceae bacterium]
MARRRIAQGRRYGPVRIGLAGCGNAAQRLHLPALRRLGARVTALADPDRSALDRLADRYGVVRRHSQADALIDDPEVDVVAVLTPPIVRAELVVPALEAGKHVLVEKPLGLDLASCDRMLDAAGRHPGPRVMVGFPMRFHRLVVIARDLIAEGGLGAASAIRSTSFGPGIERASGRPPSHWRTQLGAGGGTLFEMGVHHYDLWRFLVGSQAEEVWAATELAQDVDQASIVTARLAGGILACSVLARSEEASNEVVVHGSKARLDVDLYRFDGLSLRPAALYPGGPGTRVAAMVATVRELPHGLRSLRAGGDHALAFVEEWRHFLSCVRDGSQVRSTLEDGREATRLALAAVQSAQRGTGVRVSDESAAFTGPSHP